MDRTPKLFHKKSIVMDKMVPNKNPAKTAPILFNLFLLIAIGKAFHVSAS